jgi:hypothetical protein
MRKSLVIVGFALIMYCVIPPRIRAQSETADGVKIMELQRRLNNLDDVGKNLGALGAQVSNLAEGQRNLQTQMDAMNSKALAAMTGMFLLLAERLLSAFGVKIRDKGGAA